MAEEGGFKIVGPFGLRRPLAGLDFRGRGARPSILLDEEPVESLQRVFGTNKREAEW